MLLKTASEEDWKRYTAMRQVLTTSLHSMTCHRQSKFNDNVIKSMISQVSGWLFRLCYMICFADFRNSSWKHQKACTFHHGRNCQDLCRRNYRYSACCSSRVGRMPRWRGTVAAEVSSMSELSLALKVSDNKLRHIQEAYRRMLLEGKVPESGVPRARFNR